MRAAAAHDAGMRLSAREARPIPRWPDQTERGLPRLAGQLGRNSVWWVKDRDDRRLGCDKGRGKGVQGARQA